LQSAQVHEAAIVENLLEFSDGERRKVRERGDGREVRNGLRRSDVEVFEACSFAREDNIRVDRPIDAEDLKVCYRRGRLSFLLQLNLAEVPAKLRIGLPDVGLLSVSWGRTSRPATVASTNSALPRAGLVRGTRAEGAAWRDEQTGLVSEVGLALEPIVSFRDIGSTALRRAVGVPGSRRT